MRLINDDWIPIEGLSTNDYGPLPQGIYVMEPPQETATHGPYVIWLNPGAGNEMAGRSGFALIGPPSECKVSAVDQEGCIIAPQALRQRMYDSGDRSLQVIQ